MKGTRGAKTSRQTSLADSAFWRDLDTRFRELQPEDGDGLRAEWDSMDRQWRLRDTPSTDVFQRFEQNAEYAAKVGFNRRSAKSFHSWLELLKRETHAFHVEGKTDTRRKDEKMRHGKYGSIQRVCEVSATYCQRLGNEAYAEKLEVARAGDVTQDAGLAESQGDAVPVGERKLEATNPPRRASRRDPVKEKIVELSRDYKGISQLEICRKLDQHNDRAKKPISPLESWQKLSHDRTWEGNLKNLRTNSQVKKFISIITAT